MKIYINGLSALRGGGQTYLINLLNNASISNLKKVVLILSTQNEEVFRDYDLEKIIIDDSKGFYSRWKWENRVLPTLLSDDDIYFAPGGIVCKTLRNNKTIHKVTMFRNMLPFEEGNVNKYKFGIRKLRMFFLKKAFLVSFKNADKVIFISQYAQDVISSYIKNIKEKSEVIYHGISDNFVNPDIKNNEIIKFNNYFLYVSYIDNYKSQMELIYAWKKLKENNDFDYQLLLVGDENNSYGKKIRKAIKRFGLEKDVVCTGPIQYKKLPIYYQNSKAIIFASKSENCPNILLESMASGKMIFCSSKYPMPEFGQESVIYFKNFEPTTIEKTIIHNIFDDEKIQYYENQSKLRASNFSWKKTTNETFDYLLR